MSDVVDAVLAAAGVAQGVVGAPGVAARWTDPSALRGYTVGGLAGHIAGVGLRIEALLAQPEPTDMQVVDLLTFYGANRVATVDEIGTGLGGVLIDDGEKRAAAGPGAVVDELERVVDRLRALLPTIDLDRLVPSMSRPGTAAPLDTYLRTRVVEWVVHADDLAVSVGLAPIDVPRGAADVVFGVVTELARARAGDLAVIRAFTRSERADPEALRVF